MNPNPKFKQFALDYRKDLALTALYNHYWRDFFKYSFRYLAGKWFNYDL